MKIKEKEENKDEQSLIWCEKFKEYSDQKKDVNNLKVIVFTEIDVFFI